MLTRFFLRFAASARSKRALPRYLLSSAPAMHTKPVSCQRKDGFVSSSRYDSRTGTPSASKRATNHRRFHVAVRVFLSISCRCCCCCCCCSNDIDEDARSSASATSGVIFKKRSPSIALCEARRHKRNYDTHHDPRSRALQGTIIPTSCGFLQIGSENVSCSGEMDKTAPRFLAFPIELCLLIEFKR